MEENDQKTLEFSYDLFRAAAEEKIIILGINENTDGSYSIEIGNAEPEIIDKAKKFLKDFSNGITIKDVKYSIDGVWVIDFELDKEIVKNYQRKEWKQEKDDSIPIIISSSSKSEEKGEEEEKEEEDDRKGVEIVKQENGVTTYADGIIEIDVNPWKFAVVPKALTSLIPFMKFATIFQQYDWARLVGLFLGDDDFKDNEAYHNKFISGRWIIKGTSPFGETVYYEIHDDAGGDTPQIYTNNRYGLYELAIWLIERFKDKKPIEYKRTFTLPNKKTAEFGIDKDGNPWHTWNRCGWLSELGL